MSSHHHPSEFEMVSHAHPVLPDSSNYHVARIQCDVAPGLPAGFDQEKVPWLRGWRSASGITLFLHSSISGERRVLCFTDVCCVQDLLADSDGFYILDVRYRAWEHVTVEVGHLRGGVCFLARSVQDVTEDHE